MENLPTLHTQFNNTHQSFFFQSTSSPLKHSQILETGKTNTHKKNKVFFWKYGQLEDLVRAKADEEEAADVAVEVLVVDLLDVAVTVGPMSTSSCFRIASMAPISAPPIDLPKILGFPISESASKRLRLQLHRRVQRARMYAIRIYLSMKLPNCLPGFFDPTRSGSTCSNLLIDSNFKLP